MKRDCRTCAAVARKPGLWQAEHVEPIPVSCGRPPQWIRAGRIRRREKYELTCTRARDVRTLVVPVLPTNPACLYGPDEIRDRLHRPYSTCEGSTNAALSEMMDTEDMFRPKCSGTHAFERLHCREFTYRRPIRTPDIHSSTPPASFTALIAGAHRSRHRSLDHRACARIASSDSLCAEGHNRQRRRALRPSDRERPPHSIEKPPLI